MMIKTNICAATFYKNSVLVFCGLLILSCLFKKCYGSLALEFITEPFDMAVPEGNSALLQCSGKSSSTILKEGKIAPNIRWRGPDGQDIGIVGDTFRTQSSNGSLYISSVEENRGLTGLYQCLLSIDGIGTIVSRPAKVSISKFPDMNQDTNEIYLFLGQTAYFKCITSTIVNSQNNFQITWTKDDAPLRFDHSRMLLLPSGSLEIDDVTSSDRGTYQCNVTSGNVCKRSSKSNLNIKSPAGVPESFAAPTFAAVPLSQTVREGETVTLDCVANGNPKPTVKWLKNGEDIDINDLDSRFRIVGTGSLQISSAEDSDSGNFQCRASNTIDSQDAAASLQVLVPPKFIYKPSDKIAFLKDELEFICSINGKPTPVIQWLKNGDLITPNDYMQLVQGHNLKIFGLLGSDAGMFQCIGSNPAGSVQAAAHLEILESDISAKANTQKTILQNNQYTKAIQKTALDSLVSKDRISQSFDTIDFVDDTNNDDAYENDDYNEDEEGSIHPWKGEDPNKLLNSLISAKREDVSYFSQSSISPLIRKQSTLGVSDQSELARIPSAPRDLQAQIVKPRFITLNWLEPLKNPDEVISYTVFYKMNTSERERKITTKSRDDQEVIIQSLPGKIYQFRVAGNSHNGPGESSELLEVDTQSEENIAGSPQNLKGFAVSHTKLQLSWEPPVITNGIISKYRIYYSEDDYGQEMYTDSSSLNTTLTDLKPYTDYTISVVPFNQNGMGDPSNEIKIKTFSSKPTEAPLNVSLEATSSTSITIRWEPPPVEQRNGQITGYKIRYRKLKKPIQVETTPANIRHFELKNLERKSVYQVKIAAININDTGPFSTEWFSGETYENDLNESKVPGPPSYIRTRPSSESITVHWGSPAEQQVKVRGYVIGWGKGIPDEITQELDDNARYFEITALDPNNQYVISLSSRNLIGNSQPVYDYVRTREDIPIDAPAPLEVPVGLRAVTMSVSSIVLYWTDTMLNKNQHVTDNRYYVVRYGPMGTNKFKYHNATDLNVMITDLKSYTQYEFAVKVVKGRRESAWSMSVLNTTMQSIPLLPPRELKARSDDSNPVNVVLTWNSPKHSSGTITGYVLFFTTDKSKDDRDWSVHAVIGDVHNFTVKNLKPLTTYYFKIQSRTGKILGPFSNCINYTTGRDIVISDLSSSSSNLLQEMIVYIIVGISITTVFIAVIVIYVLCRRKLNETPDHAKTNYQKNNTGVVKPPDLWIHHDQMELKNIDKNHLVNTPAFSNDGASSSGAMTLPRSIVRDFDTESTISHVTTSLDKRNYVPGYMNNHINQIDRPQYHRTQYSMPRSHMSMEVALSQQNLNHSPANSLVQTPENQYTYDTMPSSYSNVTYAPGISVDPPKHAQGHPLKSFSVPVPPLVTPVIPIQSKYAPAVTIRPQNASPFRKPVLTQPIANRVQSGNHVITHSSDEVQRLAPSTSTEELNQEMANLEGLMKDLSAITANQFEC